MRTGNKLLLAFVALVVLLMLFSDIVLWANFKRGITGNEKKHPYIERKHLTIALQPVKVLVLTGNHILGVTQSDSTYLFLDSDTTTNSFIYSQTNDTLSIQMLSDNGVTLCCPNINTVLLSHGSLSIHNQRLLSQLNIRMGDSCYTELMKVNIGMLNITGGIGSTIRVMDSDSKIDSFRLQLGKHSSFESYDVPYQYTNVKMDSIKTLEIKGRSLNALKEIK